MFDFAVKAKRTAKKVLSIILDIPTITIVRIFGKNLTLTYDNLKKKDGLGAQVQRVMGVCALTKLTHTNYMHSGIKDIAVHPLDPYQEQEPYLSFIDEVNKFFDISDSQICHLDFDFESIIRGKIHNRRTLLWAALSSWRDNKYRVYALSEPYFIVDTWPSSYHHCVSQIVNDEKRDYTKLDTVGVVLHYRWGVGGMAIQNGEKYPRELPKEYFFQVLEEIRRGKGNKKLDRLTILTDAPKSELVYQPPQDQISLWHNSPSFASGQMFVKGADFFEIFENFAHLVVVIRGGSALDAIKTMARADILIQSKSSLSYVAGILNTAGEIYYPHDFWHPKLKKWKQIRNS